MTHFRLLTLILVILSGTTHAEIEKLATPTDSGIVFQWRPKVQPPLGWHFDKISSQQFGLNALAPDGSTFSEAETVMYAKAEYKPRVPETESLAMLIETDISDFHHAYPGMALTEEAPMLSADRKQLKTITFAPSGGGNWEKVAYGEDDEFYLVFAVSSRTRDGFEHAMPAFKAMVESFRFGS